LELNRDDAPSSQPKTNYMKTTIPRFGQLLSAAALGTILCIGATDASAQKILIDFGSPATPTNPADDPLNTWNNIPEALGQNPAAQLLDLVTTTNAPSDVDFFMVSRFNAANANGTLVSTQYVTSATRDSLFGNTEAFNNISNIFPAFKLSSLDLTKTYDLTFYASRIDTTRPATENRETLYTITGGITGSVALNALNNVDGQVTFSGMTPDIFGEITISLTPGPNNNHPNHFTYMGVLEVVTVPEPASALALTAGGIGLLVRRRRPAFA
jgi:hypothetical protein